MLKLLGTSDSSVFRPFLIVWTISLVVVGAFGVASAMVCGLTAGAVVVVEGTTAGGQIASLVVGAGYLWMVALGLTRPPFGRDDARSSVRLVAVPLAVVAAAQIFAAAPSFRVPLAMLLLTAVFAAAVWLDPARWSVPARGLDRAASEGRSRWEVLWPRIVSSVHRVLGGFRRLGRVAALGAARITAPFIRSDPATVRRVADPSDDISGTGIRRWLRRYSRPAARFTFLAIFFNWTLNVGSTTCNGCGGPTRDQVLGTTFWTRAPEAFGRWVAWDSVYYVRIALVGPEFKAGHQLGTTVGTFPGYPLLIRAGTWVMNDYRLSGVLITVVSGLAASLLFWKWMDQQGMSAGGRSAGLWLLLLYPYSFMLYGAVYADALLLALVLGSFVLVESKHYVFAGLVGAAGTLTRPAGLPIIVGLLAVALEREGVLQTAWWLRTRSVGTDAKGFVVVDRFRPAQAAVGLSALGVGAYGVYCWSRWGNPMLFYDVQHYWGHGDFFDLGTWLKIDYFTKYLGRAWSGPDGPGAELNAALAGVLTIIVLLMARWVGRRFGWGYAVYVGGVVATILVGAWHFSPGGRFLIASFPIPALMGGYLDDRRLLRRLVLGAFFVGATALTVMYGRMSPGIGW